MGETLAWARGLFRRYYRREPVYLPPRFGRREFGFLFPGQDGMRRHTRFSTREDLSRFLAEEGPNHVYYSAAYYEQADATRMDQKGWLGADLIFDLDADHMPGAEEMTRREMLGQVREEAVTVAEDFLLGHFGFDAEDLRIAFSGGRGYHIHVTDPTVHELGAAERREIVDYVTANGLATSRMLRRETFDVEEIGGHASEKKRWQVPPAEAPGWPGRFTGTLVDLLAHAVETEPEEAETTLTEVEGIGDTRAANLVEQLDEGALDPVREGRVDHVPALANKDVLGGLAKRVRERAAGEADEPVTADVRRLIRLPGSLHGGSGLHVKPLTLDELRGFQPLDDAIALPDDPVRLELETPWSGYLDGEHRELAPGEHEVPTYLAAFVALPTVGTSVPGKPEVRAEGAVA
jgi:DNA primase small subunit